MEEFSYTDGALMCEALSLQDIAEEFGTPLYVYSRRSLIDHCRHIERAFGGIDHRTCYAVKANANPSLLRIIAAEGLGADVVSGGELRLALASGFAPETITFSSVGKRDDEIDYAIEQEIHAFNVESTEELEVLNNRAGAVGKKAPVLLRVNLDIRAGGHRYITTSVRENKFGIPKEQAIGVLGWARDLPHIHVRGIHSHLGSQITDVSTFTSAATSLVELVNDLRREGIDIGELDFGGGFGVQYRGYVQHPDLPVEDPEVTGLSAASLVKSVLPVLKSSGCSISIQPGRSIMAHTGVLLVRVLFRKESGSKVFIVADGGMNDLLRPSLYQAFHQVVPLKVHGAAHEVVDVVGPVCEAGDFFALDRSLPRVTRGDYLAVMCTGAYGFVLASNYNARPRPAEILVDGSSTTVIRRRESVEDLFPQLTERM